jgi:hypothetical protein
MGSNYGREYDNTKEAKRTLRVLNVIFSHGILSSILILYYSKLWIHFTRKKNKNKIK